MILISKTLILLIALLHFYIMFVEMFLWDKAKGLKMFNLEKDFATSTKVLAANQGLYNGFLAVGLLWGFFYVDGIISSQITLFFLTCIFVAGIYGALTFSKKIIFAQSLPSFIAIVLVYINS